MDLIFNIIFYGIIALIPLSLIFILALDKKSKLRNELIDNARQKRNNGYNHVNEIHDSLFNDPTTDPAQDLRLDNINNISLIK